MLYLDIKIRMYSYSIHLRVMTVKISKAKEVQGRIPEALHGSRLGIRPLPGTARLNLPLN